MTFGTVVKAFDTVVALRDAAKRLKGHTPPAGVDAEPSGPVGGGLTRHIEARLTGVVVAALKEAFDRDHARLELERAQIEEARQRAEEERTRAEAALRMELRRQEAERELTRLRLLGATAFVGWIAAVALLIARLGLASPPSKAVLVVGWILLLASLGAAFTAQARVGRFFPTEGDHPLEITRSAAVAPWLLIAGLATSAVSLLL